MAGRSFESLIPGIIRILRSYVKDIAPAFVRRSRLDIYTMLSLPAKTVRPPYRICTLYTRIEPAVRRIAFFCARATSMTNAAVHMMGTTVWQLCIYNYISIKEYKFIFIIIFIYIMYTVIFYFISRSIFHKFND